uniref:Uncharacterized protein n=1 Tax=Strigamia maritima TaxID=126957 RepID=T1JPF0_STRMM
MNDTQGLRFFPCSIFLIYKKMCETEVSGAAQLCFPKDRSWFQGHLVTDDDGQFTIRGVRYETDELRDVYRMSVHDHEQFLNFTLVNVQGTKKEMKEKKGNLELESQQVHFESQREYKGQRADIMIQSQLPDLVGRGLDLFVGQMKLVFSHKQTPLIPYPTWSRITR